MIYVLDFKGFYLNRVLEVKELAYFCLDTGVTKAYHFKPSRSFDRLSDKEKNVVSYYEKYVHGLPWNIGYVSLDQLNGIIPTQADDIVYVCNSKRQLTSIFLAKECVVEDIKILENRVIKSSIKSTPIFCISSVHSQPAYCAVQKVMQLGLATQLTQLTPCQSV